MSESAPGARLPVTQCSPPALKHCAADKTQRKFGLARASVWPYARRARSGERRDAVHSGRGA